VGIPNHSSWIIFTRQSINGNEHPRILTYINTRIIYLQFSLRKNFINYRDINLISFFNGDIICFIFNIYSDDQQIALKYLKNTEVNLNNVLIMTGDFNIRDNNWNPVYSHHLIHTDTLREVADYFNLELLIFIIQVSMRYPDNFRDSNSVINLMFLWANSEESNIHKISLDLWSLSNHTSLSVNIIIREKFIQDKRQSIIKNSNEEAKFINELKSRVGYINMSFIPDCEILEKVV